MIKRLLLIAATVASIAVPAVEAQARGPEDRYDRREDRRDRREDRRDSRHNGGPRDRIEDRYDRREDRRDRREDRWDRNHRDWWRGRSEFRGYNGRRNGYYYAPGYGYYRSIRATTTAAGRGAPTCPSRTAAIMCRTPTSTTCARLPTDIVGSMSITTSFWSASPRA